MRRNRGEERLDFFFVDLVFADFFVDEDFEVFDEVCAETGGATRT
jgi:hypothetical protein